jgi:basic membrane protein A
MSEVAPGTSLVTSRICWEPYVLAAVQAVMMNKSIESNLTGHIHGNDVSAGCECGWVDMDDLNLEVAAPGTRKAMDHAIEQFKRGYSEFVFKGNYMGVDPENPEDTVDLSGGYIENETTSYPLFHYILKDVVTVEE